MWIEGRDIGRKSTWSTLGVLNEPSCTGCHEPHRWLVHHWLAWVMGVLMEVAPSLGCVVVLVAGPNVRRSRPIGLNPLNLILILRVLMRLSSILTIR